MTATSAVTWPELVYECSMSGRLPVVIPTASAPLVGYFDPTPKYEIPFMLACLSQSAHDRCTAMVAACMFVRYAHGMET